MLHNVPQPNLLPPLPLVFCLSCKYCSLFVVQSSVAVQKALALVIASASAATKGDEVLTSELPLKCCMTAKVPLTEDFPNKAAISTSNPYIWQGFN